MSSENQVSAMKIKIDFIIWTLLKKEISKRNDFPDFIKLRDHHIKVEFQLEVVDI
jgi:hypothetical protein